MIQQTQEQQFLKVFQKVTKLVSMVRDHQQVMDTIVTSLPGLLRIDACTIRLLESTTNTFVLGASHGLSMEYVSRQTIDTDDTMETVKSGHPVAKVDLERNPSYKDRDAAAREGINSVLTLPILFQDSIIGVMRLLTKEKRIFSQEEISFSLAIAEQVGIAISNARMFKEMENQVDFLNEVQQISKLVNSTLELEAVLQTIVERVPKSMGVKACTIRLFQSETNNLELVASYGVSHQYLKRGKVETEKNIVMALSGEPVAIYDVARDDRVLYSKDMEEEGIRSLLAIPVKVDNEIIGVLRILSDEPHCFSNSEVNFAVTVAEAGGTAINNAGTFTKISLLFQQIEENERFLSNILNCIRPQLIVIDRSNHVVLVNQVFLDVQGIVEAEALGMEYHDLCIIRDGEGVCPVDEVFRDGTPSVFTHEIILDGNVRWVERSASPMFDKDGKVEFVIEIIRDVTEKHQFEEEQMERVKLQGVVEMAGTVAHEINSPLFAALGTAQLLEEDIIDTEYVRDVGTIIRNLKIISKLTEKMTKMTGFTSREYVGDARIVDL